MREDGFGHLRQRHAARYHHHRCTDQRIGVIRQEVNADDFLRGFIGH